MNTSIFSGIINSFLICTNRTRKQNTNKKNILETINERTLCGSQVIPLPNCRVKFPEYPNVFRLYLSEDFCSLKSLSRVVSNRETKTETQV